MEATPSFWKDNFGCIPSAKDLSAILGGDPSGWGRILKGQCEPSGEYHARLKRVWESGKNNATLELSAAKVSRKYGWKTRKGRLVPNTRNIFFDIERFCAEQIVNKEMDEMRFENDSEELLFYFDEMEKYTSGVKNPRDYFDDETLERDFLKSLS